MILRALLLFATKQIPHTTHALHCQFAIGGVADVVQGAHRRGTSDILVVRPRPIETVIAIDENRLDEARAILESLIKESPQFTEAHVSLSLVYYRLKRPEDSKREREIVLKLTAEAQAKQPGAKIK